MKNYIINLFLCIIVLSTRSMNAQGIQGSGNHGGTGSNFNIGIGVGAVIDVGFTPGHINNPSGKPNPQGDRNVFWVHGLNGDIGSWSRAATASQFNVGVPFPPRKLFSIDNFTYTQSSNALDAGRQIGIVIRQSINHNAEKDFIIAHSQGGIVSRGLLDLTFCKGDSDPPSIGGLVTFCSPHQGANLLNNKAKFEVLAIDMCQAMNDGPLLEKLDFKILGFPIPGRKRILMAVDSLCSDLSNVLFPLILNKQTPNITKDYEVGSDFLESNENCINSNPAFRKFPKVAYYGVEPKEHLMLRTLMYFVNSSQGPDYFQANEDFETKNDFDTIYMKYYDKYMKYKHDYEYWDNIYNSLKCYTWLRHNSVECTAARRARDKYCDLMTGFKRGLDFLDQLDDQYKYLIEALKIEKESNYYCVCYDKQGNEMGRTKIDHPGDCEPRPSGKVFCFVEEEINYVRKEFDSDGVVLASSASNLPAATYAPQEMKNSSHMQARNDEQLRLGLIKLYDGGTDPYFKTDTK